MQIPMKVEVFVSLMIPYVHSEEATTNCMKRLGYLSLDPNDRSGHQARELKSIFIDSPATVVRLVFHNCYSNKLNTYSQVGLMALIMTGDPFDKQQWAQLNQPGFAPLLHTPSDGQEQLCGSRRQVASLKGVDARIHEVPALDSAVDSSTATQIHQLQQEKHTAVHDEDYDEAKRLKSLIERLKVIGEQIKQLELKKCAAVEAEDYDAAKLCKMEIEKLRQANCCMHEKLSHDSSQQMHHDFSEQCGGTGEDGNISSGATCSLQISQEQAYQALKAEAADLQADESHDVCCANTIKHGECGTQTLDDHLMMREMMALGAAKFQTASGGMKDDDNMNNAPFKIHPFIPAITGPNFVAAASSKRESLLPPIAAPTFAYQTGPTALLPNMVARPYFNKKGSAAAAEAHSTTLSNQNYAPQSNNVFPTMVVPGLSSNQNGSSFVLPVPFAQTAPIQLFSNLTVGPAAAAAPQMAPVNFLNQTTAILSPAMESSTFSGMRSGPPPPPPSSSSSSSSMLPPMLPIFSKQNMSGSPRIMHSSIMGHQHHHVFSTKENASLQPNLCSSSSSPSLRVNLFPTQIDQQPNLLSAMKFCTSSGEENQVSGAHHSGEGGPRFFDENTGLLPPAAGAGLVVAPMRFIDKIEQHPISPVPTTMMPAAAISGMNKKMITPTMAPMIYNSNNQSKIGGPDPVMTMTQSSSLHYHVAGSSTTEDLLTPEPLTEAVLAESGPLLAILELYYVECLLSKQWQLRDKALQFIIQETKLNHLAGHDPLMVFRVLSKVLIRTLNDRVSNVFNSSMQFLRAFVTRYASEVPNRDLHSCVSDLVNILLEKLGDSNARTREASSEALMFLASKKEIGLHIVSIPLLRPTKNQGIWRPFLGRLQLLLVAIPRFGLQPPNRMGFSSDPLMSFVGQAFNSPNGDVRNAAVKVTTEVYRLMGAPIEKYLKNVKPVVREVLIRNFERVANETAHGIICMPGSSGDPSCSNAEIMAAAAAAGPSPPPPPPLRCSPKMMQFSFDETPVGASKRSKHHDVGKVKTEENEVRRRQVAAAPSSSDDDAAADKHKFGPATTKMNLKKPPASFDDMPVAGPPSPLKTACQNVVELCTVTTCAQLQAPAANPQLAINHDNKDGNTTSSTKSTRASSTSTQLRQDLMTEEPLRNSSEETPNRCNEDKLVYCEPEVVSTEPKASESFLPDPILASQQNCWSNGDCSVELTNHVVQVKISQ